MWLVMWYQICSGFIAVLGYLEYACISAGLLGVLILSASIYYHPDLWILEITLKRHNCFIGLITRKNMPRRHALQSAPRPSASAYSCCHWRYSEIYQLLLGYPPFTRPRAFPLEILIISHEISPRWNGYIIDQISIDIRQSEHLHLTELPSLPIHQC